MNTQHKAKGFTIIEVVLVLAIAGLIFLMVFIALPALQRSQRDTQRRDDVSTFSSQLTSYSTNNRGELPPVGKIIGTSGFAANYLKWQAAPSTEGEFNDPKTGEGYKITTGVGVPEDANEMRYGGPNTHCDNETIVSGGGNRQAAIAVKLEGSGVFCQNAQQG